MPLVLAIKNRDSVVIASDVQDPSVTAEQFGQLMMLSGRAAMMIVGNMEVVRQTIMETVRRKITPATGAATLAQIVQAALTLELVPHIDQLKGRVEIIVAGIDAVRHTEVPSLYYMDSAQDFYLQVAQGDAVAAGSTAAVTSLLVGHDFGTSSAAQLQVLAKECLSATKLRWPEALAAHIRLGVITSKSVKFQDY